MNNNPQNAQHQSIGLFIAAIYLGLIMNSACNLITSDPCDDTEASLIEVEVKATVNLTDKVANGPLSGIPVYLTFSKQPCGGEKKAIFYMNNSSDSLGNVSSDLIKYTLSNLNDLIYIDVMVICNNGSQGLWSSCLKYNDFAEKGYSQTVLMNLEINKNDLKKGLDSLIKNKDD
ncbi:MAG TPA: hypothetical protein VE912_06625 [Bacteroidales bacterium]|nr:hypothetical protein [Bacteroidales bacterium]